MQPGDRVKIANWVRDRVVVASQGQRWWVPNVTILLQHKCLLCVSGKIGGAGGKRKRPKKKQMEEDGGLVAKGKGDRSKKEQDDNPNPKSKIAKVFVHSPFHVPKMQFQPAVDDLFIPYPVLCEQLNNEHSVKQVALVMLYPGSTTVVDAVTVCNAEWKHRSTL